uniref:NADH-ubiquinone oxidoreductase chain 6 n=1 Tax=Dryocoetes autographus TaxID=124009 RepID=A0A343A6F5_DRYAU|nr:NADH dehydrogenase subunit 6 [Dryocoetes autographus]AOY40134.1 NADH dehydrogenase subunit 6 [Dryocoetes autographus]
MFLFFFINILSFLFMTMNHPLSLGYILLLMTINTSLTVGLMYLNFWFGYIIFLIMVGGMLVMFIYMTSVASNEKFSFPKLKTLILFFIVAFITMLIFFTNDEFFSMSFNSSKIMINQEMLSPQNKIFLTKIFNEPLRQIPVALMNYLLVTLIVVVKMTDFIKGPLRQK